MTKEILYFIHNKDVTFYVKFLTEKQKRALASRNNVIHGGRRELVSVSSSVYSGSNSHMLALFSSPSFTITQTTLWIFTDPLLQPLWQYTYIKYFPTL